MSILVIEMQIEYKRGTDPLDIEENIKGSNYEEYAFPLDKDAEPHVPCLFDNEDNKAFEVESVTRKSVTINTINDVTVTLKLDKPIKVPFDGTYDDGYEEVYCIGEMTFVLRSMKIEYTNEGYKNIIYENSDSGKKLYLSELVWDDESFHYMLYRDRKCDYALIYQKGHNNLIPVRKGKVTEYREYYRNLNSFGVKMYYFFGEVKKYQIHMDFTNIFLEGTKFNFHKDEKCFVTLDIFNVEDEPRLLITNIDREHDIVTLELYRAYHYYPLDNPREYNLVEIEREFDKEESREIRGLIYFGESLPDNKEIKLHLNETKSFIFRFDNRYKGILITETHPTYDDRGLVTLTLTLNKDNNL